MGNASHFPSHHRRSGDAPRLPRLYADLGGRVRDEGRGSLRGHRRRRPGARNLGPFGKSSGESWWIVVNRGDLNWKG